MMKTPFLMLILAFTLSSAQASSSLNSVVLGYDMEAAAERENPYIFPCKQFMGALFCDNSLVLEDVECAKSLSFTPNKKQGFLSIACRTKTGEQFEIARTSYGAKLRMDDTQDGMGYLPLDFNPRVSLDSRKAHPNGVKQELLLIK